MKLNLLFTKRKIWLMGLTTFLLIFSFFYSSSLSAQGLISRDISDADKYDVGTTRTVDCDDDELSPECIITLPPIDPTLGYTFTVPFDDPNANIESVISNCPDLVFVNGTITFPADPNFCRDYLTTDGYIEFTVNAAVATIPPDSDALTYRVRYLRKPIKLVLVLDISGSMQRPVFDGLAYGDTRWNVLKNAVASFLTKYDEFKQNNDKVGLTYFTTDVVESNPPLGNNLTPALGAATIILADINSRQPLSLTAMGKGLIKAKDDIIGGNTNDDHKKVVFLFTDGLQNVPPLANTNEVSSGEWVTFIGEQVNNYRLNDEGIQGADSIFYYCVAMSIGADLPMLLADLTNYNGGSAFNTTLGLEDEIMNYYDEVLTDIAAGGSPQIVAQNEINSLNSSYTIDLEINANISKIVFELNHRANDRVAITKIEKDGFDLTRYFKFSSYPNTNFVIASSNLPLNHEGVQIDSKGTWKVTVTGTATRNIVLKAFVDDHLFKYRSSTGKHIYTVGDPINLSTKLSYGGNPLANSGDRVSVLVLKPGDDIGHLLATYATPNSSIDTTDTGTPFQQKLVDLLYGDTAFYNSLIANEYLVELIPDGAGGFSGKFSDTQLTGVYQTIFLINAEHSSLGKLVRTQRKSVVYKFGQLDSKETEFTVDVTPGDKGQNFSVVVRPKNKFGYYLGPGFTSYVKVDLSSTGGYLRETIDNLDGSYTIRISEVPNNVKPQDLSISIMGEDLALVHCKPVTIWCLVILIILILLAYRFKQNKIAYVVLRVLIVLWVVLILLRYFGIICIDFL